MTVLKTLGDFPALVIVIVFAGLMIIFAAAGRQHPGRNLREIHAFTRLRRAVGLAVEAGTRLHISLGRGGIIGPESGSALAGFSILERITRAASISDRPPVATSGDSVLSILSQDTLRGTYRAMGVEHEYKPESAQLTGLTPLSYAAGAMPVIRDGQVSANVLAGHFGSEVALLIDAGERAGSITIAGTDSLPGQAVLFAAAHEPLIGEELFAGGAYLGAGALHVASLRTLDVSRWTLIIVILIGALARFVGIWK
jgi:hypothetical protein